jgi:hypothetical protein
MNKKAAQHVAAFLLLSGVIKTISKDINARSVDYFTFGGMIILNSIDSLYGSKNGY